MWTEDNLITAQFVVGRGIDFVDSYWPYGVAASIATLLTGAGRWVFARIMGFAWWVTKKACFGTWGVIFPKPVPPQPLGALAQRVIDKLTHDACHYREDTDTISCGNLTVAVGMKIVLIGQDKDNVLTSMAERDRLAVTDAFQTKKRIILAIRQEAKNRSRLEALDSPSLTVVYQAENSDDTRVPIKGEPWKKEVRA